VTRLIIFYDNPTSSKDAIQRILASLSALPSEALICPIYRPFSIEATIPKEYEFASNLETSALIMKGELAIHGCTAHILSNSLIEFSRGTWRSYAVESTVGVVLGQISKSRSNLSSFILRRVLVHEGFSAILML
jgi:hypothetical protein